MCNTVFKKVVSLTIAIIFAVSTITPTASADTDALRAVSLANAPQSVSREISERLPSSSDTKSFHAGSYVVYGVDAAKVEKDLSKRIVGLERLHFLLRLLPLAVDIKKETGDDSRVLEILAEITGKDMKGDAEGLRKERQTVEEYEWRYLYQAMAKAYLETGDIWRAIYAFNAVLQNGGYDIGEAELKNGEVDPEELLTMFASLYAILHPELNLKAEQLPILIQAFHNPETLRRHRSKFRLEKYRTLAKIVAYHQIMTRDAQYTAAKEVSSESAKKGLKSYAKVFGLSVKDSAQLLNELSDILNEVPDGDGRMRPFAGVEIIDNPHEITYKLKRIRGKVRSVDKILYDNNREIKVKGATIVEHQEVREGDIIRRFDIMEHGQWFSYRTYDLRSAFRTTVLELPGIKEQYPALMSKKLIFYSAIELGTTMLEGMGLKDKKLKEQIEKDPQLYQQLKAMVWGLVSGGCRLPIQEHRDVYALGLLYSGVNAFLIKSNQEGFDRTMNWIEDDIEAGQLQSEDVERFKELASDFEEKGIISTPMYYLIVNLLWNDGIRVGEGREDLLKAYKEAEHLLFGGGHGTASHNPWEFSGWKQMLSWFNIILDKSGNEDTLAEVLSINDAEMQGLKEGIIAGRTRPGSPKELEKRELKTISAVEVAYTHYLYSAAYIRLGRDVWGWLWDRAIHQQGGIRSLIMATRELHWDNEWDAIRKDLGKKLSFSKAKQAEFDKNFPERPLLCWQRPFEKYNLPALGLGYQHGSGGLDQIIFRALGQKVLVVHDDPDYMFPDGEPYPNIPWFVRGAMKIFEENGVEIAIIGDEDKDRLICWLPQLAKMVQGDELMGLRAMTIAKQDIERAQRLGQKDTRRTIFYVEVKFYAGLKLLVEKMKKEYWQKHRIRLHMDVLEGPVGFGYVKDEMKQTEGSLMAEDEETLLFGSRKSNLLVNLRHNARIGGGAEVSGHGMEPLSGAEMSAVEITDKILTPMVMGDRTFGAFIDAYNRLPKSFASPEVRIGTHHNFGRYEKQEIVNRVLKRFKKYIEKLGFKETGARRQYNENGIKYGSLYHIYKSPKPVDIELTGMTLHNVSEIGLDLIDGAKYYIRCDEGKYFTSFLNRKSNTQNEIITRVDGDSIEVRNAIATLMYGFFEQVDATDLLTEEDKKKGEPPILLSRDLWVFYEVLPRLAYRLLPERLQKQLDKLAEELTQETLQALAEDRIIEGLKVENRDKLGYFYSFEGEREEGYKRIVHWTEKMLGAKNPLLIPEEQDLGEMVDTFLGYRLSKYLAQAIRKEYHRKIKAKTARYNTARNYDYIKEEGPAKGELGFELLAARYVTRRVKDQLAVMDVARLRKEEDLPNIEVGQTLLFNTHYLFKITAVYGEGIYEAQFIQIGPKPDFIEDGDSVIIRRFPAEKVLPLEPGKEVSSLKDETFITFDPSAILNDRETGFLVTKGRLPYPQPAKVSNQRADVKSFPTGEIIADFGSGDRTTRKRAYQSFRIFYPHLEKDIDEYYNSLPVSGKAIFNQTKRLKKPVMACNIDNGGGLSALQIPALMQAAKDMNAFIIFEVGPGALLTYAEDKPQLPEYCAKVAYEIYKETGYVVKYAVHLDHNQINKKKFKTEPEAAVQEAVGRAVTAIRNGFTSVAIDTSTLPDLDDVISTAITILRVVYKLADELGITLGIEGEIDDIGTKISTVDDALRYVTELAEELGRIIDLLAGNFGSSHGFTFTEDDTLKPYEGGAITIKEHEEGKQGYVLSRVKKIARALEELKIILALHGYSSTPTEVAKLIAGTGVVGKVNINTDWQAIEWKVLQAWYPGLYRRLFNKAYDLALDSVEKAEANLKKALEEQDMEKIKAAQKALGKLIFITADPLKRRGKEFIKARDYDFEHAKNRIMFGFARKVFRNKDYHKFLEEIANQLKNGRRRMAFVRVTPEQAKEDYLAIRLRVRESSRGLTPLEAIYKLTYERAIEIMKAKGLKDSAKGIKVDRPYELRLQDWQKDELMKAVDEITAKSKASDTKSFPQAEDFEKNYFGKLQKLALQALIAA